MKPLFIPLVVLFMLPACANAVFPDPQNSAILLKLSAILKEHQIGHMLTRKQIAEAIKTAQSAANTYNELKQFTQYRKEIMQDITHLKKLDLLDSHYLESFILNGDRLDFYLKSSSRKFLHDVYTTSRFIRNINKLEQLAHTLKDSQCIKLIQKNEQEKRFQAFCTITDLERHFALLIEQAKQIRDVANDKSVQLSAADRVKMSAIANELITKATEFQLLAARYEHDLSNQLFEALARKKTNEALVKHLLNYSRYMESRQNRAGFFDSKHIQRRP